MSDSQNLSLIFLTLKVPDSGKFAPVATSSSKDYQKHLSVGIHSNVQSRIFSGEYVLEALSGISISSWRKR